MKLFELLGHPIASLPTNWTGDDFIAALNRILRNYLDEIDRIDPQCVLGQRVRAELPRMEELRRWLGGAVKRYFDNEPDFAYRDVVRAVDIVRPEITNLFLQGHQPLGNLYRASRRKGHTLTRARLFHTSTAQRHFVGSHRYGIPGFPCIYLGGSPRVCLEELRIQQADWSDVAFARFEPRHKLEILDFGFRPGFIGRVAHGLWGQPPNVALENFVVRYAVAWPLIAACSIINRYDGKFAVEYIIPHAIVQWLLRESMVDGIRFFSTRLLPRDPAEGSPHFVNYAFPAVKHQGFQNGYSRKLINILAMTDVVDWQSTTAGRDSTKEYLDTQAALDVLPIAEFIP